MKAINVELVELTPSQRDKSLKCKICGGIVSCPGGRTLIVPIQNPVLRIPNKEVMKKWPDYGWILWGQNRQFSYFLPSFIHDLLDTDTLGIQEHSPNEKLRFKQIRDGDTIRYFLIIENQHESNWIMILLTPSKKEEKEQCQICGCETLCRGGEWVLVPKFNPLPFTCPPPASFRIAGNYFVHKNAPIFDFALAQSIALHLPQDIAPVDSPWTTYNKGASPEPLFKFFQLDDDKYTFALIKE